MNILDDRPDGYCVDSYVVQQILSNIVWSLSTVWANSVDSVDGVDRADGWIEWVGWMEEIGWIEQMEQIGWIYLYSSARSI